MYMNPTLKVNVINIILVSTVPDTDEVRNTLYIHEVLLKSIGKIQVCLELIFIECPCYCYIKLLKAHCIVHVSVKMLPW